MAEIDTLLQQRAALASPAFTGTPTAPTPATADNSTKVATTAFVKAQGYLTSSAVTTVFGRSGAVVAQSGDYSVGQVTGAAPIDSPAFTTTATAPTPATADNSTKIATTAFVKAQGYLTSVGTVVNTFKGRSGAVTPTSGDYTAAQVTNAADLSDAAEQDFNGVIQAPNVWGVGGSATSVGSGGSYNPTALNMVNLASVPAGANGNMTINNPGGVVGSTNKVGVMSIVLINNSGVAINPTITWGTAYRFGGMPSTPGGIPDGQSYMWTFMIDMPQSRVVCIGATQGTYT